MLADVNLITPVTGGQAADQARIKRRDAKKRQRVNPKGKQQDAQNQEEAKSRQPQDQAGKKTTGLEVYA